MGSAVVRSPLLGGVQHRNFGGKGGVSRRETALHLKVSVIFFSHRKHTGVACGGFVNGQKHQPSNETCISVALARVGIRRNMEGLACSRSCGPSVKEMHKYCSAHALQADDYRMDSGFPQAAYKDRKLAR